MIGEIYHAAPERARRLSPLPELIVAAEQRRQLVGGDVRADAFADPRTHFERDVGRLVWSALAKQ
jgi:hypothetical protein